MVLHGHTTSRYSGSFESQVERDFAAIADLASHDASGFLNALNRIVDDTLTSDFWTIRLPNELATSAARSPALFAYMAALNILDADALLATGKVRERLDPAVTAKKGIERHHLFPRAYLRSTLGVKDPRRVNQIANMAFVEWNDNIAISDKAPAEYWPEQVSSKPHLGPDRLNRQVELHALPTRWTELAFDDFLTQRRRLMSDVVRQAFAMLSRSEYDPQYPAATTTEPEAWPTTGDSADARVRLVDLLRAGLLPAGTVLTSARDEIDVVAEIDEQGRIVYDEITYDTPSAAAVAVTGTAANDWTFWLADTPQGQRRLDSLRSEYQSVDVEATDT